MKNSQMETMSTSDTPLGATGARDQIKTDSYVWHHVTFDMSVLSRFPIPMYTALQAVGMKFSRLVGFNIDSIEIFL